MQKPWISILDLSAYSYSRFPEGHQLAVLRSFLDGSGKSSDPQCKFLTLVGVTAPPVVWPAFEVKWQTILDRHGVKVFHAQEESCRDNSTLVGELLHTFEACREFGMRTVGVSVDLTAHRSLSVWLPNPGHICAKFCINDLLEHASSISCLFDRGEEFLKEVNPLWEVDGGPEWPELARVHELAAVRQVDFPGLQAADLLAWHINRSLNRSDHEIEFALTANRTPGTFRLFDVTALYAMKLPPPIITRPGVKP